MKRILPILFAALAVAQQSSAATNVSGLLTGTVTWTKANSPYIVTTDLAVDSGATLIIEAGVEVRINQHINFFVDGGIRAIGTPTEPIIITSNLTNPSREAWKALDIRAGNIDSIVFNYCHISHGDIAIWGNSSTAAIIVDHCEFSECDAAMHAYAGTRFVGNTLIRDCNSGIYASGLIINNEAHHVGLGISSGAGGTIKNNFVHDCWKGIHVTGHHIVAPEVSDNTVVNCQTGFEIMNGKVNMQHNLSTYNGVGYQFYRPADTVRYNTSIHDSLGVFIHHEGEPLVFRNNCIDSTTTYRLKTAGPLTNLDISNNYWGTTNAATVDSLIYDFYDNLASPTAIFSPLLQPGDGQCQHYNLPTPIPQKVPDAKANTLAVYPNPFNNSFSISLQGKATALEVFNMARQKLISIDATNSNKMEVDMSAYPAGVYHYRVAFSDHTTATGKLIKQ